MNHRLHYTPPDFMSSELYDAPYVQWMTVKISGVAPTNFHATSNHPEYFHVKERGWLLAPESRMDAVVVWRNESLVVLEPRCLQVGDCVAVGRSEAGEQGIFVHTSGFFLGTTQQAAEKFAFRTRGTRETPFSRTYDELYDVLRHDRAAGYIVWVLGPAVAFDQDSREAMQGLIEDGFCHALMAGNALATHDLEAAYHGTGLGQDIYNQSLRPLGHYHHLDVINAITKAGSIQTGLQQLGIDNGIIHACEKKRIPYLLAGSIRDDGPLPGVIRDSVTAQNEMRVHAVKATTVITLATQLHAIAFGNMTPSYRVMANGQVRPVFFYVVDISEFSADKLANRGSAQAVAILTNVQDFIVNLRHNLLEESREEQA